MKKLTLEQRVARLEKLMNEDATEEITAGYLNKLASMIFKNRKLNPKGLKPEDHTKLNKDKTALIIDNSIGNWIPLDVGTYGGFAEDDLQTPDEATVNELKKMIAIFCKNNKCRIDWWQQPRKNDSGYEEIWIGLNHYPEEPRKWYDYLPDRSRRRSNYGYAHPDDQWEDPDFQDMRNAERWAQSRRDNPGLYG